MDSMIYCKFFGKEISVGLCEEVLSVSCRLLKKEAVPEISDYTREEIDHACDGCPYPDN